MRSDSHGGGTGDVTQGELDAETAARAAADTLLSTDIQQHEDLTTTAHGGVVAAAAAGLTGTLALSGDLSPAQITADQNDYSPTSLSTAGALRLNSDAARSLTGLAGGADGRVLIVHNVGAFAITLVDESASSTAANRFALEEDIVLATDSACILWYDSTSSRWRQASASRRVIFDATSPSTQAIGDAAAAGSATVAARRDHKHAMPAFATPAVVLGTAAAAGAAATLMRSDATIAAFDATVPATQAFGDAAAAGSAAVAARRDHKHAMPANPLSAGVITGVSGYLGNIINPPSANSSTGTLANQIGSGLIVEGKAAGALAKGDLVCINSSSQYAKCDANATATSFAVGICLTTATNPNDIINVLVFGLYRDDSLYNWTPGAQLYMSETAGALTATAPTTTDAADAIVAIALSADVVFFCPQFNFPTHT